MRDKGVPVDDIWTVLDDLSAALERAPNDSFIVVGGAAAAIYTGGEIATGDVDIVSDDDQAFRDAMEAADFDKPDRAAGLYTRSTWIHRGTQIGVQLVGSDIVDTGIDRERATQVGELRRSLLVAPIEDVIADRVAQAYEREPINEERMDQARVLFQLASELDESYLARRIEEETSGEKSLASERASLATPVEPKWVEPDLSGFTKEQQDLARIYTPMLRYDLTERVGDLDKQTLAIAEMGAVLAQQDAQQHEPVLQAILDAQDPKIRFEAQGRAGANAVYLTQERRRRGMKNPMIDGPEQEERRDEPDKAAPRPDAAKRQGRRGSSSRGGYER